MVVDLDNAAGDDGEKGERDTIAGDVENIIGGLGSDAALDRVYGGSNTAVGDSCYVRAAGVVVNCELVADTRE